MILLFFFCVWYYCGISIYIRFMPETIPWIAIAVSVIANMIIGMIWFGPLFGKKWMELVGLTEEDVKNGSMAPMIVSFVGACLTAFIYSVLSYKMGADSLRGFIETSFWIWLGFMAISSFTNASFAGRTKSLWAIESFYWLISWLVMAIIFSFVVL